MIYFVELWSVKQAWLDLTPSDRAEYMTQVGAAIQGLMEQGVQILTWSKNNNATAKRISYDYIAIWAFPTQAIADEFQGLVEGAGWYNYFEQVNAMGAQDSVENVIGDLVQL